MTRVMTGDISPEYAKQAKVKNIKKVNKTKINKGWGSAHASKTKKVAAKTPITEENMIIELKPQ